MTTLRKAFLASSLLLLPVCLAAQSFTTGPCTGDEGNTSNNSGWFSHHERVCVVRRAVIPLVNGQLNVTGRNGGIEVFGEDRADIALEARVIAQASSREDAQALQHEISIATSGTIQAKGPDTSGWSRRNWSVNFRLHVPRRLAAAHLHTENGGIDLTTLEGQIEADTVNGGLTLKDLAGDIHATTVNGGLDITLTGDHWRGQGLSARSTNGGVDVKAPGRFSAHLIADTVNGGIEVGFPITIQGTIRNHIETDIGQGGPTIHVQTVNGGVSINRD